MEISEQVDDFSHAPIVEVSLKCNLPWRVSFDRCTGLCLRVNEKNKNKKWGRQNKYAFTKCAWRKIKYRRISNFPFDLINRANDAPPRSLCRLMK